jgi:hypothetical protein
MPEHERLVLRAAVPAQSRKLVLGLSAMKRGGMSADR